MGEKIDATPASFARTDRLFCKLSPFPRTDWIAFYWIESRPISRRDNSSRNICLYIKWIFKCIIASLLLLWLTRTRQPILRRSNLPLSVIPRSWRSSCTKEENLYPAEKLTELKKKCIYLFRNWVLLVHLIFGGSRKSQGVKSGE